MLYISTSKINESTVGASFTVSFSVAPEEIGYLTALHEKYSEMNMCGFTIKPSDSEKPNNSQTCANCKFDHEEWFEEACDSCCDAHSNWQPKTEPTTEGSSTVDWKDQMWKEAVKTEPQTKCDNCKTYWNCQGQCDEIPQIEDEPQIIACPIQEEDADYARWLYEDEPHPIKALQDYYGVKDEPTLKEIVEEQTDCAWGKGEDR